MPIIRRHDSQQYQSCRDGCITVYLLEAHHEHLPLELAVYGRERVGHRMHRIDKTAQIGRRRLLDVVEQSGNDGRVQRPAETRSDKSYDTHGFEIICERHATGQRIGQ